MNLHFARDGSSIASLISHKKRKFLESMEVSFYFVHKNAIGSAVVGWKYRNVPGWNSKADRLSAKRVSFRNR